MAGQASYVDSSVVLSLFLGDSGFAESETWLLNQGSRPLWISHWVLLEVAGVLALCIRRGDLSNQQARQWLLAGPGRRSVQPASPGGLR
jgi:predicted nucleic acid-binding protein